MVTRGVYCLKDAEFLIDFTRPEGTLHHLQVCQQLDVKCVIGTTGFSETEKKLIEQYAASTAIVMAPNMGVGVNVMLKLLSMAAKALSTGYDIEVIEAHHRHKIDAPSGTAITLAEGVIKHTDYANWTLETPISNEIHIEAKRIENVPGTHSIFYDSEVDQIEIKHTAHSREGFALGAVVAAEWLVGKKGVFTMKDVLGLR